MRGSRQWSKMLGASPAVSTHEVLKIVYQLCDALEDTNLPPNVSLSGNEGSLRE